MFWCYLQITAEQALQLVIELQHTTEPEHSMTASFKVRQSAADSADAAAESARGAAVAEVGMISSAAKQMLQTLAEQHSCKCQPIFSSSHIQQLLQPCVNAFCQPETVRLKGSAPAVKGSASDAKGSAAVMKGGPFPMKGARLSSERQCLPINVETVDGHWDAADMSAQDWQMRRYRREDSLARQQKCAHTYAHVCMHVGKPSQCM